MPSASPLNRAIVRSVLTMRCTVWARTSGSGPYNSAVKTGLACYLAPLAALTTPATSSQRAELAGLRTLMWDPLYAMPVAGVQIEVTSPAYYAGQRWNLVGGTIEAAIPPGFDGPIAVQADVRRAN